MPLPEHMAGLFEKLKANQCSPAELETIVSWLAAHGDEGDTGQLLLNHLQQPVPADDISEQQRLRLEQGLRNILTPAPVMMPVREQRVPFLRRYGWWAAACLLLLLGVGSYLRLQYQHVTHDLVLHSAPALHYTPANYVRSLTLPDGSTVVLGAGSRLIYPPHFSGDTREVKLTGEAYFDITSDKKHPFIIYTGTVKTTVLGTAFNIKAYPDQEKVVVSVTRGKVRVEDATKVLAELTPDQQVTYTLSDASATTELVHAKKIITDWTKQDMAFENITFEATAKALEKRYDVHIRFANEAVRKCLVFSSFDGTETLEKVLNGLARVQNITYSIKEDNKITIDGIGCQ